MWPLRLPPLPEPWAYFTDWRDLLLAAVGAVVVTLLIIWWRQQTRHWFRVCAATFLAGLLMCISSFYLFVVPPYFASCPQGCPGWRGYPLPIARIGLDGVSRVAPVDFAMNLFMLWLLWLGASLIWTLLGMGFQWWRRTTRARLFFVLVVAILPWALMPRLLEPPQPRATGEDLRLAVNARRAAEFTYRITGLWVQRLALEDIRTAAPAQDAPATFSQSEVKQVCLRGYTYFYIPWRRYRITLDPSGVTALSLTQVPLDGSCWR
ncbi:hypothetical protein FKZ61_011975 [Litorilinea aerophila]|uniref:Uncharacterized protein n=1 Tax=Litorilinea aerophila TaxID=1204385 RepID=A0A540VFI4_9CHLR|nr:hypothetical protein [Litorilinea aerophila]MCC9076827.1 hypothetical protein [Litorilinea aerophila]GIV76607.1 MAG: hypothetical protein KatS3mg050_1001 [Litorilinea sp.]